MKQIIKLTENDVNNMLKGALNEYFLTYKIPNKGTIPLITKEVNENKNTMTKNKIKLTESQLHKIIEESIKKMLNEIEEPYSQNDEYDEDGYDKNGWYYKGEYLNNYNRKIYEKMKIGHEQARNVLLKPTIQLKKYIEKYVDALWELSETNEYINVNEEDSHFFMTNDSLAYAINTLAETINFLKGDDIQFEPD